MKSRRILLLLTMLTSLTLSACADSGFSVIHTTNHDNPEQQDDGREEFSDDVGVDSGGSSGSFDDDHPENPEQPNGNTNTDVSEGGEDGGVAVIDMTDRIIMFKFNFVEIDEDKYVHVTFDSDPLGNEYDYSYYTVNNVKVENQLLEKVDSETQTYKINLDSVESGKYTIAFFNQKNKQYGVAYIDIANDVRNTTYVAMAIGIAQIQLATFGYNIMTSLQKIGDFFTWLFTGDTSSGMTFGE